MTGFLWAVIAVAIFGCVAALVIAIVGTIADNDRRFSVIMMILGLLIVTMVGCGVLGLAHKAHVAPDIASPVQIEPRDAA